MTVIIRSMKKRILFLPLLFLLNCSEVDYFAKKNISDSNKPPAPILESDVFNLNLVSSVTLEFSVAEWNKLLQNYDLNPKNEKKVISNFTYSIPGKTINLDSIGVKLRGNSSRRRPEGDAGELHNALNPDWHHCHFALDFSKFRNAQRFKGLNKINLKWFKDDPTYSREIYSYDLFQRFGCWTAPRASYCKVTIKVSGDGVPAYYGVYVLLESVDESFIVKRANQWGSSIGFLWKNYNLGSAKADFVSTNSMGVEDVNINPTLSQYYAYDLKTRQTELAGAQAELTQFITDLNTKTGIAFQTWIAAKMDVSLFLKTYATSVVLGMWDDYWVNANNFYFYFGANGKAYFIPYDYDNTLGTSALIGNSGTQNPLVWGNMTERPLVTKILAIPEYQTLYKAYIKQLTYFGNDYFAVGKSIPRIQSWQAKIAGFIPNDTGEDMVISDQPAYWGNQPNYRLLSGNSQGGINGLGNYFRTRTSSVPW